MAVSQIWITLGPLFVINAVLATSFLCYHIWIGRQKQRQFAGAKNQGSKFLSTVTREWWFWTTDPIVRLFVRLRIGPNVITILGVLIAGVAALLFAYGWFGYAGWAMVFGASFDFFDGRVARMTGRCSRSGAFFDSVTDRFSEGLCFLGLAYFFRESWMLVFVIAALIGSNLVSYTRARGEAAGVDCTVGSMQRPERITYLGVASILDPVISVNITRWWPVPPPLLVIVAIVFIAVMTLGTATYRMIYIMNELDTEDKREKETIPQLISKLTTTSGREELWDRARYGYDRSRAAFSHVVLFYVGGINSEFFRGLVKSGDLPGIARHIVDRGGMYDVVETFPSTAGTSIAPFVTGCFPGTCDIPGVRWFDRTIPEGRVLTMNRFRDYRGWGAYAMDFDLSKSVRTIFEYSRQAVNIFGILNRGCGFVRDPAFFRLHSHFQQAQDASDLEAADEAAMHWFASAVKRETDFVLYSFPPMSFRESDGKSTDAVRHSYRKLDESVGRAVGLLKKMGMYDETVLMLAADHGQGPRTRDFDLGDFLTKRYRVCPAGGRMKDWQEAEVISLPSGTSMSHIYVRKNDSWAERTFFEDVERRGLVGSLLERDEVDILAGRSVEGGIVVQSRRGRAHVLEDADGRITYMIKREDPFGFCGIPQVAGFGETLKATVDSDYPDGIVQLLQLFRSRRAGDIVLSAAHGTSLVPRSEGLLDTSTHGSLSKRHLMVPFMSSVSMNAAPIRSVDIFSTIIDILGIEPAHSTDGVTCGNFGRFEGEEASAG